MSEPHEEPLSVHAAIAEVMARMPAIPKGDKAPGSMGGFQYRGIESITTTLQPILAAVGLVIIPQARTVDVEHAPGQKEAWQDVRIVFDWLIVGPDGSTVTATTVGVGRDHTDKGANKAQSQAYKYLLMGLFMISDAASDSDGHDYTGAEAPPVKPDPVNEAIHDVMSRLTVLNQEHPAEAEVVKAWAHGQDKKLSPAALAADPKWLDDVARMLDELEHDRDGAPEEPF